MGYIDAELLVTAITGQTITSDSNSTDYLDTELTYPGWEKANGVALVVDVMAACNDTTGMNILIVHKASEPTTGDATLLTVTCPVADLTAGNRIVIPLPSGIKLLRYVRAYFDEITGDNSTFSATAYFSPLPVAGNS
jgi:hypothetical protein